MDKQKPRNIDNSKSSIKGMIAGNIIGDMLGLTQMSSFGSVSAVRPIKLEGDYQRAITGGGIYGLPAGSWTDDTSMLIALAESLLQEGSVNPDNERWHYLKWFRKGEYTPFGEAFDLGQTTRTALETGRAPSDRESNGNGALMRSSVITAWYLDKPDSSLIEASGISCAVTHAHPLARFVNIIYNLYLKKLILGEKPEDALLVLKNEYEELIDDLKDIFIAPEVYMTTSYCVTTLETAIWLNLESSSFEEALLKAINLGGDGDTIGAVTGAIAGALYGWESIPDDWAAHALNIMNRYKGLRIFI